MDKVYSFFNRHKKVALQFSAGKDSAACLWALKDYWDRLTVIWCNQGDPYPETVEYMERIKKLVPNFVEIRGEVASNIRKDGFPVDVLPMELTTEGQWVRGQQQIKLVSVYDCCRKNFWIPMAQYTKEQGFTGVIRGQRSSDTLKAPIRSGDLIDGIEYLFPIENLTDEHITQYLGSYIPESYKRGLPTSLDCKVCTAYMDHNIGRVADLENIDPNAAQLIKSVHRYLRDQLTLHMKLLNTSIGENND